mgnify:CR=1 FL=1
MKLIAFGVVLLAAEVQAAWPYDTVDAVDLDPLGRIVSEWQGVKPKKPHKVLLFSECFGYNHHGGRCYGDWAFKKAGEASGAWEIVQVTNVTKLADASFLEAFDAIVLNNSSGVTEAMAPGLTDALTGFVKAGKGLVLIHAGLDAFKDSDRILDMVGGYFRGHPWHEDGTWKLRNEAGAHPVNASFANNGVTFFKQDEIYQFPAFFDRKSCQVLISVDLSDPLTKEAELWWNRRFGPSSTRADHDYAVSWVKNHGKGRVFYTTFGHDRGAFLDRERLYHMFAGLQYALGDFEEDVAAQHGPAIAEMRTDWAGGPWGEKLDARVKAAKGQDLDFVFFGDSITMGWAYSPDEKANASKKVWKKHFGELKTLNLGMSGDRVEHLLWRVASQGQADGWTAKTIFVMIGINNRYQRRPGWTRSDTPEETASGTKAVIDVLKSKHPESKIVLFGALPYAGTGGYKWVRYYNAALSALEGGNVVFRDIGASFLEGPEKQKPGIFSDGLHPNAAGYEIFATEMEKILGR